jgi:F-type H+-transporting ATPase subunit b
MDMLQSPYFWTTTALIVLVLLARKPVGKAASAFLDAHAARIRTEIQQAQTLRVEAEALLVRYREKQVAALAEAETILENAKAQAARITQQASEDAKTLVLRKEAQAAEKIARAEQDAINSIRTLTANLAVAASERLLTEQMTTEADAKLVDRAIGDLAETLHRAG